MTDYGLEIAINGIMNAVFNTSFAGQMWLMYIIVIATSLMIITRVWRDWATLALPVMVGWRYFGVQIPYVFLAIGTIMFIIDTLSIKTMSGAFEGISSFIGDKSKLMFKRQRVREGAKRMRLKDEEAELIRSMKPEIREKIMKSLEDKRAIEEISREERREALEESRRVKEATREERELISRMKPSILKEKYLDRIERMSTRKAGKRGEWIEKQVPTSTTYREMMKERAIRKRYNREMEEKRVKNLKELEKSRGKEKRDSTGYQNWSKHWRKRRGYDDIDYGGTA